MDILFLFISLILMCFPRLKAWAAVIILFLSEDFFQLYGFITEITFLPNPRDAGLMAALAFCCLYGKQAWKGWRRTGQNERRLKQILCVLLVYVFLIALGDFIVHGTTVFTIMRTSRKWFMIFFVLMAPVFSPRDVGRLLHILLWITLGHSLLVIYESVTQDYYWTVGATAEGRLGEVRGSLPAPYALFYTSLLAFNVFRFKKWETILLLCVLVVSQLVSATRSIALALVLVFIVAAFYQAKNKLTAVLKVIATALAFLMVFSSIPILRERFMDAAREQKEVGKSGEVEGSTTFRLLLLQERYDYLKQHPGRYVFGIGNVHEDNFPQIFKIGLLHPDGKVVQLDTGDILWPLIILRLGMLGLCLFLWIHISYLIYCWRDRHLLLKAVMAYMTVNLLILSFASTALNGALYLFLPTLLVLVSYRYRANLAGSRYRIHHKYPMHHDA